ncbi:MAG: hypothetical protein HYX87_06835 [Chloroflexi bacterium]|nr:hypothetical protein [Chloroflexota bacterium]
MDERERRTKPERIPLGQVLMDDIYLLLALGLGIPLVFYVAWSVIDVMRVPLFKP